MTRYSVATIALIVFFTLYALAAFGVFAAPSVVMGLIALVIAIALAVQPHV